MTIRNRKRNDRGPTSQSYSDELLTINVQVNKSEALIQIPVNVNDTVEDIWIDLGIDIASISKCYNQTQDTGNFCAFAFLSQSRI